MDVARFRKSSLKSSKGVPATRRRQDLKLALAGNRRKEGAKKERFDSPNATSFLDKLLGIGIHICSVGPCQSLTSLVMAH